MDAGHRRDPREAPAGADDHLAADPLADDRVRGADVLLALRGDRGGLDPEAGGPHRGGRLVHDAVLRGAAVLEREVEVLELDLEPEQVRVEHAQRLLEQLLARFVAVQDDDLDRVGHPALTISDGTRCPTQPGEPAPSLESGRKRPISRRAAARRRTRPAPRSRSRRARRSRCRVPPRRRAAPRGSRPPRSSAASSSS